MNLLGRAAKRERILGGRAFASLGIQRGRQALSQLRPPGGIEVASVRDATFPGSPPVGVRIYHPSPGDVLLVLVWAHGGGWCLGDLDTADRTCRAMAVQGRRVVVSIDYRRAPEHPFPQPIDDVEAALRWVVENARDVGGDAADVTMAGESAGANLAIAACRRSNGAGLAIARLLLVVPVVDLRADRPSMRRDPDPGMPVQDLVWFGKQYLPSPESITDPEVAPLAAPSLACLPPTTVVTAGLDPLRDGGLDPRSDCVVSSTKMSDSMTDARGPLDTAVSPWRSRRAAPAQVAKRSR